MQGRRAIDDADEMLQPGEYARRGGVWHARCPTGLLANLGNHAVVEFADGTITVQPSIRVSNHEASWHGYLLAGVWSECP